MDTTLAQAKDDLIVALDVPTVEQAVEAVSSMSSRISRAKVGLELCMARGPIETVKLLRSSGLADVMLDLKLHDIPATMEGALKVLKELKVWGVTVHASAGPDAMKLCMGVGLDLIGVTVLTSIDAVNCRRIYGNTPLATTLALCEILAEKRVKYVVCSPEEVGEVMKGGFGLIPICPGIRPDWYPANDQKRTLTPAEAIRAQNGGGHIVVGRPIMKPLDGMTRAESAQRVLAEMAGAY